MSNDNMFETASRTKLRFTSLRGDLTTEQLWDVPLRSRDGFDLDAVAKEANKRLKAMTEESFVSPAKSSASDKAELALEIVKRVISIKLAEEEAAATRASNRQKKERLLQILAEKQAGALSALSEQEIQNQIKALDA